MLKNLPEEKIPTLESHHGVSTHFGETGRTQVYNLASGHREPTAITNVKTTNWDTYLAGTQWDGSSSTTIKNENGTAIAKGGVNAHNEFKRQFNNMAKSVAIYGGFYIGRYELGNATPYTCYKGQAVYSSTWYNMYNKAIKANATTTSQMMWQAELCQVWAFVHGKTDAMGNLLDVDKAVSARHTGSKAASGANRNDLVCNIYDLEGNYCEYTGRAVGANSTNGNRNGNAGTYNYTKECTSTYFGVNPGGTYTSYSPSTRPALYVNY
ncbi:MAG: hypothetical protein IKP28_03595 [Clostridia bacterium]|nr:hypothetical protein [Clostridia bacterium]